MGVVTPWLLPLHRHERGDVTQTTQVPGESVVEATRRRDVTYWVDERNGKFPLPWWKLLPLIALIGAAAVAIMTLIMIPIYERQVINNAKDDLRAAGIDPSTFNFDASYRDLDITGILPAGVTEAQIRSGAANADGLRDLDVAFSSAPDAPAEEEPDDAEDEPVEVATGPTDVMAVVTDSGVVLTGEVPDEEHREVLVAEAEARFGAANVTDELTVSGLEPATSGAQDRVLQLGALLGGLPDGAVGSAAITDSSFTSDWTVGSEADADAINATVTSAKSAFADDNATTSITVDAPAVEEEITELQEEFDDLAVEIRENVTFATNSDVLNDTATATLDKVVDLMTTYTQPVVEISGHTDAIGDDAFNLELSDQRAASVRQYLIDAGIDESRIESIGKGETDPFDTNDTPEGRANNRRVELVALRTFVE